VRIHSVLLLLIPLIPLLLPLSLLFLLLLPAQVVAFAVYAFFGLSLVAEQVEEQDWVQHLPGWLILKFVFFFGWLEVAEAIQHPWGTDTDDFQVVNRSDGCV
jgi:hypothetical protein